MRTARWLMVAGLFTTLGCAGPWVTEGTDVPVVGEPVSIETHRPDQSRLDATTDNARFNPYTRHHKARKMAP